MEKVKVLKEEKRTHNLYAGRIYYMNVKKDKVYEDLSYLLQILLQIP